MNVKWCAGIKGMTTGEGAGMLVGAIMLCKRYFELLINE